LGKRGLQVRALHIPLKSGELETLATNLGEGELGYEAFAELYHLRWGIETEVYNGETEAGTGELFGVAGGQ
jgi:hypothetical protein